MFRNAAELVAQAKEQNVKIAEIMIQCEMKTRSISREEVIAGMEKNLVVMEQAVERGIRGVKSPTGLTGGDAVKVQAYKNSGKGLSGDTILDAVSKAVATNEVNAAMGIICATPTAGSAGTVPGTVCTARKITADTRRDDRIFIYSRSFRYGCCE